MHVRRTDKIHEAPRQPLEKYMKHVENYYRSLDLASPSAPPTPRRVFLATEQPSVVQEARLKLVQDINLSLYKVTSWALSYQGAEPPGNKTLSYVVVLNVKN